MDIKKIVYKFGHLKFSKAQLYSIAPDDLINRITHLLDNLNYNTISSSPEKIVFTGNFKSLAITKSFKAISVTNYSGRLQAGVFDLHKSEKGVIVKLTYFITILSEIIMLIALIILALLTDCAVLILGVIILFIRVFIKINNLKRVSKNLISALNLPLFPPLQPD